MKKTVELFCYKNGTLDRNHIIDNKAIKKLAGCNLKDIPMDMYAQVELDTQLEDFIKRWGKAMQFDKIIMFNDFTDSVVVYHYNYETGDENYEYYNN